MKSLRVMFILAALAAALTSTVSAQGAADRPGEAGSYRDRGGDDDRDRDSDWQRVDSRGGGQWEHRGDRYSVPERSEMRRIRALAYDLNQRAEDLSYELYRGRPVIGTAQERNRAIVEAFRMAASEFFAVVDRNMTRPDRTVSAFQRLEDTYDRLSARNLRALLGSRSWRHLDRIAWVMESIEEFYARPERERVDWIQVERQALAVDNLANRIYIQAKRELYQPPSAPYDWRVQNLLDRLAALSETASDFYDQVDRGRRDPWQLRRYFDELAAARRSASSQIGMLSYVTRNEFYRLNTMIQQLESACFKDDHYSSGDYRDQPRSQGVAVPARPSPTRTPGSFPPVTTNR